MDRYKQVHLLFFGLVPATVFGGLAYKDIPIDLNVILLALLIIALRTKFYLDDEAYFHDVEFGELPGGLPFVFGLATAVGSWVLWVFAAFFVKDIERSSLLMLLALVPSTVWIVAAMVKRGAYAEQVPWLCFNVFYGVGFYLIAFRGAVWNPFSSSPSAFALAVLLALLLVFLFDFILSRLLEHNRFEARKTRVILNKVISVKGDPPAKAGGRISGKKKH